MYLICMFMLRAFGVMSTPFYFMRDFSDFRFHAMDRACTIADVKQKKLYKVIFHNEGKLYEIYAREVAQANLYGFVEIGGIQFGEKSAVVVDPSEEKLKAEFDSVKRTWIPLHAVVRVDEVEKPGTAKVTAIDGNVAAFPGSAWSPGIPPK